MNWNAILRASETWVAVAVAVGQVLVALNVVPQAQWDNLFYPALTYIIARLTGKVAKKVGQ